MTTSRKKSPTTKEPQSEPPKQPRAGDALKLGPISFDRLFCHSPECIGDHKGVGFLTVYLHWSQGKVVIEPVVEGLENFRSDMLDRYFPVTRVFQQVCYHCPLILFFNVKILSVNGGFDAESPYCS